MNKPLAFISVAAAGFLAYAAYFDYTRRNDPNFRKSLKKRAIRLEKDDAKAKTQAAKARKIAVKKALLADVLANPPPTDAAQKENYFLEQISLGERLAPIPGKQLEAALCFYKALTVYPNPTDVLNVYKNSVPTDVYEIVSLMIAIQPPASISTVVKEKPAQADLD